MNFEVCSNALLTFVVHWKFVAYRPMGPGELQRIEKSPEGQGCGAVDRNGLHAGDLGEVAGAPLDPPGGSFRFEMTRVGLVEFDGLDGVLCPARACCVSGTERLLTCSSLIFHVSLDCLSNG